MYETALTALEVPFRQRVGYAAEAEVRRRQEGLCVGGHHTIPAAADGDGEVRKGASREGPDAKNGYGQAGGRTLVDFAEGECVAEFGAVEEVQ